MKIVVKTTYAIAVMFLLLLGGVGCESTGAKLPQRTDNGLNRPCEYDPAKVDIMPLTEFAGAGKIKVYVSLLDAFDCQIKAPAIFRFELYDKVPRSAEPKGKRIFIWPDIDLKDSAKNNEHWKDFLRTYEFELSSVPKNNSCILQVTALCPNGKRLSAEFALK
ncbi:MAG: hypothetical protein PHY02_01570 [Phycisphaerae bacterium]|nr:hypothetical protein [Phycisphaerae bacterium]